MGMTSQEKRFHHIRAFIEVIHWVFLPAQAFLPHCAVEALDAGLVILEKAIFVADPN